MITDENRATVSGLQGTLIIKKTRTEQYIGGNSRAKENILLRETKTTDVNGTLEVNYTFEKEGYYDIEFVWGSGENQSSGKELSVRNPFAATTKEQAVRQIWSLVGVFAAGMAVGAVATFLLLTQTLHPKK